MHVCSFVCCSGLFIISPDGILRQKTVNDLPVGRSVDETLRLVKAFQVGRWSGRRGAVSTVTVLFMSLQQLG
jgi:alkyl hydroperoxide reductase subunit AhpC